MRKKNKIPVQPVLSQIEDYLDRKLFWLQPRQGRSYYELSDGKGHTLATLAFPKWYLNKGVVHTLKGEWVFNLTRQT